MHISLVPVDLNLPVNIKAAIAERRNKPGYIVNFFKREIHENFTL